MLLDVRSLSDFNFVICDFGFADYAPDAGKQVVAGMKRPSNAGITPRYAAPEVIDFQIRNTQIKHTKYL